MAESSRRSRLLLWLRIGVTCGAFAYLFWQTDVPKALTALTAMPWTAPLFVCVACYFALGLGALRWRVLMQTCGATHTPSLGRLYRLSLVGFFYNNVLPGAVVGDVLRGLATAQSFEGRGATSALAVTALERISGLAGLVIVAAIAFVVNPLAGVEGPEIWGTLGITAALLGSAAIAFGGRLAHFLPGRLATLASKLPDVRRPAGLLLALPLSCATHLTIIAVGHVLISALDPSARFSDSAVVMPMVSIAGYFPLTIAGAGVREAVMVAVYHLVGISEPIALAAALAYLACLLVVAISGGALHALKPMDR